MAADVASELFWGEHFTVMLLMPVSEQPCLMASAAPSLLPPLKPLCLAPQHGLGFDAKARNGRLFHPGGQGYTWQASRAACFATKAVAKESWGALSAQYACHTQQDMIHVAAE